MTSSESASATISLALTGRFHDRFPYDGVSQAKEGVMAQRAEVILEDDIDGSPAAEYRIKTVQARTSEIQRLG